MNKQDIIRMVREVGLHRNDQTSDQRIEAAERFAELVAAERDKFWQNHMEPQIEIEVKEAILEEREACAKVCDELHWPWHMGDNSGPKECAAAIRERSANAGSRGNQ